MDLDNIKSTCGCISCKNNWNLNQSSSNHGLTLLQHFQCTLGGRIVQLFNDNRENQLNAMKEIKRVMKVQYINLHVSCIKTTITNDRARLSQLFVDLHQEFCNFIGNFSNILLFSACSENYAKQLNFRK